MFQPLLTLASLYPKTSRKPIIAWNPATAAVSAGLSFADCDLKRNLTEAILTVGHANRAAYDEAFPVVEEVIVSAFTDHLDD